MCECKFASFLPFVNEGRGRRRDWRLLSCPVRSVRWSAAVMKQRDVVLGIGGVERERVRLAEAAAREEERSGLWSHWSGGGQ